MDFLRQVFINCDARFTVPLTVLIHSLLEHNRPDRPLAIHLAHDAAAAQGDYRPRIRDLVARYPFAHIEFHDFTPVFKRHERELSAIDSPWPSLVWAFPLVTELLPDITGNIVYLDADMQVRKDLGELFDLNLKKGGYVAAAVNECAHEKRVFLEKFGWPAEAGAYFNNGTMVVDTDTYRKEGFAEKIPALFAAHKNAFYGVDQDIQNVLLGTRTLRLPMKWNYHDTWLKQSVHRNLTESDWDSHRPIDVLEAVVDPAVVHYIGRFKPWQYTHRPERRPYRDEMRALGLLERGGLPGENGFRRVEGRLYDGLHALLKVRARSRLRVLSGRSKSKALACLCVLCSLGAAFAREVPHWINVPPLIEGHERAIADDQRWLYDHTVIDSSAFIVTLTPEGNPVFDKAAVYRPQLEKMKALLKGAKGLFGIQFQATMGHGWVPDSPTPWPRFVEPDGKERYIFCPLGEDFRAYLKNQVACVAAVHPDFFMVDDDTRFITGRSGCFCPLHLTEMEKRTGCAWTRERLVQALATDEKLAHVYDDLLKDSILSLVRLVRAEFDRVDPQIAGTFCCCACDVRHATDIARAVAAPGQRPVLRLNNGRYCHEDARTLPGWLHHTALQLSTVAPDVLVLDEPDTCPQNRYSMSAKDLHCHIACSLLEGCAGAKIWVTRMGQWEPASGVAFRQTLQAHSEFYRALEGLVPQWDGVAIPLPAEGYFTIRDYHYIPNWGEGFLGRMGIAYANAKGDCPLAALSGPDAAILTDADIRSLLSRRLLLDGAGAKALTERGFSEFIGCSARAWSGPVASFEILDDGATRINAKPDAVRLDAVAPAAERLSTLHHREAALSKASTALTPGAIRYRNALGGDVIVMADTLPKGVHLGSFHFYNETRKRQVLDFLQRLGYDAPYYPGDAEVLLKWGRTRDGDRILAVLDTGHDELEELPLVFPADREPTYVERLASNGDWRSVDLRLEGSGRCTLFTHIGFIEPAVFRVRQ